MTFRQASELNAHVRKGEKGSLVVYANAITRTERDDKTGEDVELEIPYMKRSSPKCSTSSTASNAPAWCFAILLLSEGRLSVDPKDLA